MFVLTGAILMSGSAYGNDIPSPIIPGGMVPDIEGYTMNGTYFRLSDYRGKYVLIDLWATWCSPCKRAYPALKELYDTYHDKGFEIIGISRDKISDADKVKKYLKKMNAPWPQYYLGSDINERIAARLNALPVPGFILIDPNRRIVSIKPEVDVIRELLLELFSKQNVDLSSFIKQRSTYPMSVFKQADDIWERSREKNEHALLIQDLISKQGVYSRSVITRRWAVFSLRALGDKYSKDIEDALMGNHAMENLYGIYDRDAVVRAYSIDTLAIHSSKLFFKQIISSNAKENQFGLYDRDALVRAYTVWSMVFCKDDRAKSIDILSGKYAMSHSVALYDKDVAVQTYALHALNQLGVAKAFVDSLYGNVAKSKGVGIYSRDPFIRAYSAEIIARSMDINDAQFELLMGNAAKKQKRGFYDESLVAREVSMRALWKNKSISKDQIKNSLIGPVAKKNRLGIYSKRIEIRRFVYQMLGYRKITGIDISRALTDSLAKKRRIGIYDKNLTARCLAIWALGRHGNRFYDALPDILRPLIHHSNEDIRKDAQKALERVMPALTEKNDKK